MAVNNKEKDGVPKHKLSKSTYSRNLATFSSVQSKITMEETIHKLMSFMSFPVIILLFVFPFQVLSEKQVTCLHFDRFRQNMLEMNLEGDAYIIDPAIKLTVPFDGWDPNNYDGSVGRAMYSKPIHLWDKGSGEIADFTTSFSFSINSKGNGTRGFGFAFFLANNGSKLLPSSGNVNLGLLSAGEVQFPFVAVEFDTVQTIGWDTTNENHIGIDVNSMVSANVTKWSYNDIEDGGIIQAWIEYKSHKLSAHVSNGYYRTWERNFSYDVDYSIDLRAILSEWVTVGFSASTSIDFFEEHEIYAWDFESTLQLVASQIAGVKPNPGISPENRKNKAWLWALLVPIVTLVFVSSVVGFVYFGYWRREKRRQLGDGKRLPSFTKDEFENENGPRSFSYEQLALATNNFSDDRVIGKGGFAVVYVGFLTADSSCVAVKRIAPESELGLKAYTSEVKTIGRLRHRNLVQLLGWCRGKEELLIIYEFMPNKSLDFHLFNKTGLLTWERRYAIALGLASGLLYLHEECDQCILHRDIKSSNVLLDSSFNAKLGDFGLARLVEHGDGSDTTKLIGTVGYVCPEYLRSSKATKESDAYSFGIVALEIVTGKPVFKGVDGNKTRYDNRLNLTEWVWEQYQNGNIFDLTDPLLNQEFVMEEVERLIIVGLGCAHPSPFRRLSIREAIDLLNFKVPLPTWPVEMPMQPNIDRNLCVTPGSSSPGADDANADQSSFYTLPLD